MPKGGKPKKLTKKQLEEEAKRKKEEERKKKEEELQKKRKEEEYIKMLEDKRLKKEEDERLAKDELERLEQEENKLSHWKGSHEMNLRDSYKRILENEDWKKYSFCDEGYINVGREKDLNGFIYEFKERCDVVFINNFKLVEKDFEEEMSYFDYSQTHYHNLERLLYQGKATNQMGLIKYSFQYLNVLKEIEKMKIESMTRYFVDNFEALKAKRNKELIKKTQDRTDEEKPEIDWEFSNKSGNIKLGFWANNLVQSNAYRAVSTNFKSLDINITDFTKYFINKYSIIRFFWCEYDIREFLQIKKAMESNSSSMMIVENETVEQYTPYMSISGVFFVDEIVYPSLSQSKGGWEIREMVGDCYKTSQIEGGSNQSMKDRYKIELSPKVYLKDVTDVLLGIYEEDTNEWNVDKQEPVLKKDQRSVAFTPPTLGIYSVLLKRGKNFPYKSWYLRCVKKDNNDRLVALLDLETPRTNFVFEVGVHEEKPQICDQPSLKTNINILTGYVKLIDNTEPEFAHLVNKEMSFDEIVVAMRYCGILLSPWNEDIENAGLKQKNCETIDRAIDDIIMASRQYAIRSNDFNSHVSPDMITTKFKPNLEFDNKFFDDEEKDWFDVVWFPNKASMGVFSIGEEGVVYTPTTQVSRPYFHLLIKDQNLENVYDVISEDIDSAPFLVNLRNFVRILGLVSMP